MRRIGIFASLRRRRVALSLAFGYALLLNALLGQLLDARMAAAAANPLRAAVESSLCGASGTAGQTKGDPADHQQQCPLCATACPAGGCVPGSGATASPVAVAGPRGSASLDADLAQAEFRDPASIYRSDPRSQAPPASA